VKEAIPRSADFLNGKSIIFKEKRFNVGDRGDRNLFCSLMKAFLIR
jgi:hypothetical protein